MSEVQSRPSGSRGRGAGRGGRGGFASRGGRSGGRSNGHDKADSKLEVDNPSAFDDDEGVIAELKQQYGHKTQIIKEMFPEWSEVDVLFALQETDGDETEAVTRIAEGAISQWGEVSKTKKVPRSKKEGVAPAPVPESTAPASRPARGGRNVSEAGRGRGRATERGGRGGSRGRSSAAVATNGARPAPKENQPLSIPTEESPAWDSQPDAAITSADPAVVAAAVDDAASPAAALSSAPKTWASMLRQSTVPKPIAKPREAPAPQPTEAIEHLPSAAPVESQPTFESSVEPSLEHAPEASVDVATSTEPNTTAEQVPSVVEPEVALPASHDELTKKNLAQIDDESHPPATATVASTAADSWDPRNPGSATATPLSAAQQQHQSACAQTQAAPPSGYAASALKATTDRAQRTPSYQRRILDQEEAVRMPGNRDLDRAAVQFGAFNLGGDEDVDDNREDAETRAQPPPESPIAQPRTSLPPAVPQQAVPDAFGAQRATGASPAAAAASNATPTSAPAPLPAAAQAPQTAAQAPGHFSRFPQPGSQEPSSYPPKPLDPFSQQVNTSGQGQLDGLSSQQSQAQPQQHSGAFTSGPGDYSSYYTSDQHNRGPYNYYGQPYGQQGGQGHQEALGGQQRSYGGYNASQADNLSQYPQSGSLHNQSRYGASNVSSDAHNSGHTTPNPTTQAQQQAATTQASQPQSHGQQNYPYSSHPYFNNPYYSSYMNYGGHFGQGGYGGPYGKGGMYQQPYGMSPQAPFDHASSPASGFGQSSLHRGDSGLSSGLGGDFGRAGSAQSGAPGGLGGSGFGGGQDSFGRGGPSFPTQPGQGFNASAQASAGASSNDDLKPFGDSKPGSGPSPSLGGARPGSATQNPPTSQSSLPPPQSASQMGGYGGYPSHLQGHGGLHGTSGYGMGGSGQHGGAGFSSYGQGYGGGSYYGSGGQQQQQRGWGGNYH